MARRPKRAAASNSAAETLAAIKASGATPLDYMLRVMRDENVEPAKRLDAAKAAAPYVHPRLASVAVGNQDDKPFEQVIRYLSQVVDTSLADYDFGAAQTRAQNRLALANDETFGGSGGSIQTALSEDALTRARGALGSQLRHQGFEQAANLANLDADRRQQAQLANMAAYNRAGEFNATQLETALGRQHGAARDLADAANARHQRDLAGLAMQAQIGDAYQKLEQQRAEAPLDTLARLAAAYDGLPLSLLHGSTVEGTARETDSVLGAMGQIVNMFRAIRPA